MKLTKLVLFLCITCLSATAFGQKFLEKPYQKWSQEEALKIISEKPFADQFTGGQNETAKEQQQREQADTRLGGSDRGSSAVSLGKPPVYIRLHSSLPVRQALVRLRQIAAGYDKMNGDDQKKFDATTATLLSCAICTDYYVITMIKAKDKSMGAVDTGLFQTMKLEDFKGKVWLVNDKGEKRELEQFTPSKGSGDTSIFFFKRADEKGNVLISPETKDFKFVFDRTLLDRNNPYSELLPPSFEFKVGKILVDGKVEF